MPRWTIAILLIALAGCRAASEPSAAGDAPLSGNWVTTPPCGLDVACSVQLRLSGTTITGQHLEQVNSMKPRPVALHGTYSAPNVHFEYGDAPTILFDGVVQGDTLLVGTETTYGRDPLPVSYLKVQ